MTINPLGVAWDGTLGTAGALGAAGATKEITEKSRMGKRLAKAQDARSAARDEFVKTQRKAYAKVDQKGADALKKLEADELAAKKELVAKKEAAANAKKGTKKAANAEVKTAKKAVNDLKTKAGDARNTMKSKINLEQSQVKLDKINKDLATKKTALKKAKSGGTANQIKTLENEVSTLKTAQKGARAQVKTLTKVDKAAKNLVSSNAKVSTAKLSKMARFNNWLNSPIRRFDKWGDAAINKSDELMKTSDEMFEAAKNTTSKAAGKKAAKGVGKNAAKNTEGALMKGYTNKAGAKAASAGGKAIKWVGKLGKVPVLSAGIETLFQARQIGQGIKEGRGDLLLNSGMKIGGAAVVGAASMAAGSMAAGALAGSVVPVVGTIIGAVVGLAVGIAGQGVVNRVADWLTGKGKNNKEVASKMQALPPTATTTTTTTTMKTGDPINDLMMENYKLMAQINGYNNPNMMDPSLMMLAGNGYNV